MSEIDKHAVIQAGAVDAPAQASAHVASVSRRRLIKLGSAAVPVVATLVSRPALAWHCKSPSAWGSEIINPNTSLRTNAGHQSYPDETWYITDWRDNIARSSAGYGNKPWAVLQSKYPALKNNAPPSAPIKTSLDYTLVTIAQLQAVIPGLRSAGALASAKVKTYCQQAQIFRSQLSLLSLTIFFFRLWLPTNLKCACHQRLCSKWPTGLISPPEQDKPGILQKLKSIFTKIGLRVNC